MADEGRAALVDLVEQLEEALPFDLRQGFARRLADEVGGRSAACNFCW
jgi:hypothetical protein